MSPSYSFPWRVILAAGALAGWKRREFLLAGAAACGLGGCQSIPAGGGGQSHTVDAGPADRYAGDGIYANFRELGFFLVRRDGKLVALSSYCTHRHCRLDSESDHTFSCPCHGSEFSVTGQVTQGPASRDLPKLSTITDARGHLLVTIAGV